MSSQVLDIWVGTTYYKLRADRYGNTDCPGLSVRQFVRDVLTQYEFEYRTRTYIPTHNYSRYDADEGMAYFPRYSLDKILEYIGTTANVNLHTLPPVASHDVKLQLRTSFEPREHQIPIIEFLTNPESSFTPLSAACGTGKTASTIAAIVKLQGPALIILGMLIDQWEKEIHHFAKIKAKEVAVIKGIDSLRKLWYDINRGRIPKIVLCSTRTLSMYCVDPKPPYSELPSYQEMLEKIGIRTKVFDECHTNFLVNTRIDLCTNVAHNIYLSATYARSDKIGKRIFDMVYPVDMRYGEGDIKRYTTVFCYSYMLTIPMVVIQRFRLAKGYSHPKYEEFLINHPNQYFKPFVRKAIVEALNRHWESVKSPQQKALILCKTQAFVTAVVLELITYFPQYKISAFFRGTPGSNDRKILETSDIIVSTTNSCSTGIDIKNLKTCINTVSFVSEPLTAQTLGRLRQLPGEDTYFVDLHNGEIPSHSFHFRARYNVYKPRAKDIYTAILR